MHKSFNVERYGGVFLPGTGYYGFLGVPEYPPHRYHYLLHVDAEKVASTYDFIPHDENTDLFGMDKKHKVPGEIDLFWQFLRGPRFPIPIPTIGCDGETVYFKGLDGNNTVRALVGWKVSTFPVVAETEYGNLEIIQENIGVDGLPASMPKDYLEPVRDVLIAFEKRRTPAELYQSKSKRAKPNSQAADEIGRGIEDYARLIHIQLEIMLARHEVRNKRSSLAPSDQVYKDSYEVRRLLHQRAIVAHWLAQPDFENLPTWHPNEGVSAFEGQKFLEKNTLFRSHHQCHADHVQLAFSSAANSLEQSTIAPPRNKRTTDHLRLVQPQDSM